MNLYNDSKAFVVVDNCIPSKAFNVKSGVRQCCILSPLLFNVYSELIIRNFFTTVRKAIGDRRISNLRYADGTVLINTSKNSLAALIAKLQTESNSFELHINLKKTKIIIIDKQNEDCLSVNGLQVVDKFIYLDSLISNDGYANMKSKKE